MSHREAVEHMGQGASTDPGVTASPTPAELCDSALKYLQAGRPLDAQLCCERALAIDPDRADSLHVMGVISLHGQHYDYAVEWLSRAIRKEPRAEYLSTLGLVLKQAGQLEEALSVLDKAIQLEPDDAELWKALGGVLATLNRSAEAVLSFQHVLKLKPQHWEAAYLCGLSLQQMERFNEALAYFDLGLQRQPDHASILFARARTLRALKRYEDALADYRRLHLMAPDDPTVCNNIGDALLALERYQEALEWFERALALRPDFPEVLAHKGLALLQLGRFDEAITAYAGVTALNPGDARSAWQLAHLHLQTGNYRDGWAEREARWKVADFSPDYPKFPQPKWLGKQPIEGRTILICADEGHGDTIQFARYLPMVAAAGARLVLVVQDSLRPLLSALPGVAECLPYGTSEFPPFDFHCPMMSLPLAFGTTLRTIPPASYLPPLPVERVEAWNRRLGAHQRLRVGLAWSGNPNQGNDRNRSMPFRTLLPLLGCEATFVNLQKDVRPQDKALLETRPDIVDFTADLTDFGETAALISNLDLVITVCTSVAHLAATLGRETWVMLPYIGDWRWLTGHDDSPWYPSVRLFRQDNSRNYAGVIERVRDELKIAISSFRG
jgi:tetratricopeptide (TPR) repeat protein